jgi:ABC-type glutathione transport system ATPase component
LFPDRSFGAGENFMSALCHTVTSPAGENASPRALLSVKLHVDYPGKPAALDGVEFEILPGEIFGLVGESGSGKSTITLAILRLLDTRGASARGSLLFQGRELMNCKERELRCVRGHQIALVPQSPMSALNPVLRLETQLREAWRAHSATPWRSVRRQVQDLLCSIDLPADDAFLRRFPHQVSVGQAQRVLIGMAVLHRPALLIADEPTSALDPGSQREILALLRRLNQQYGTAILYISHDIASVKELCERICVLRAGRVVDCRSVMSLLDAPTEENAVRLAGQKPLPALPGWTCT